MMITSAILIAIANLPICSSFSFAFVPTATYRRSASSPSLGASPSTTHNDIIDVDVDGDDNGSLLPIISRRNVLTNGGLSLFSAASSFSLLPRDAFAAIESGEEEEPFTVLLTIQVDSTKPEELSQLEIEVIPSWAPLATHRFKELVELGFYTDCPFFRVLPGFIAQFGVSADANLNKRWMYCDAATTTGDEGVAVEPCPPPLSDEPRLQPNRRGTLSFASSGKNSRRTQIFVNTGDNSGPPNFLDLQGFVPFARVVRGMDVVKTLNAEYGGNVNQGKAAYYGGEYFRKVFPRLSVIRDARIVTTNQ